MRRPRVLVLDDEEAIRDLWADTLQNAGYEALGVSQGDEALAQVAAFHPDLILLDMIMPHMDGFEFLARLRAGSPGARIPLVIVSALGESLVHSIGAQGSTVLGIAGILMKPLALPELLSEVRRVVGPGVTGER